LEERQRKDAEVAAANRERQERQGVVESASGEEASASAEEANEVSNESEANEASVYGGGEIPREES